MAIIKRKQPGRKQLKRPYKIPRSLRKSIKKNLVKIVKKRERKIRDEEVSFSFAKCNLCLSVDALWSSSKLEVSMDFMLIVVS
jgi:hypothetical protein